jgi:branched-chain amino acid transport system substrate-binding protein
VTRACPLALAAALSCLVLAGCGVQGNAGIDAPVNVYVSLPLTGPRGADGRDAADGARLALEQARGKAGSIEVRAKYLDDAKGMAWDAVTVGTNARSAVQDSSAAGYIGELDSEPTRASVPITNDAGLVQVSPGAGGVDLTRPAAGYPDSPDRYQPSGSPSFARTVPADDLVAQAAADTASELRVKSTRVESDGTPFEDLTAEEFSSAASERGIQVESSPRAESIYQPGSQRLVIAGGSPETLRLSAELDPGGLPGGEFPSQFEQRFHRAPGPYAAYGYEAMNLVLQGIAGAGTDASSFRDKVRNGVIGAHRDQTILGPYSITDDGDTTECMIQRYRVRGAAEEPLGASCPPR